MKHGTDTLVSIRYMTVTMRCVAIPRLTRGPRIFATHSTHKLLAALSQSSYIHIRDGRGSIDHERFNQAYMMHTTTSPLYPIVASNDIASAMMDGRAGYSLTQEAIQEAVDFRQTVGRIRRTFQEKGDWFFKPWNAEKVKDPKTGRKIDFEDAPADMLCTQQDPWVMHPTDKWHGFDNMAPNWCMLDPVKVSLLAPGLRDDGEIEETGVPAALVNAFFTRFGIVPTRVTDFQIMFLFSIGITKGKWGTLVMNLLAFKRHYDANSKVADVLPELAAQHGERYRNIGLRDLGDQMLEYIRINRPGELLNRAYETLPDAGPHPERGVRAHRVERCGARIRRRACTPHGRQWRHALSAGYSHADVGRKLRRR